MRFDKLAVLLARLGPIGLSPFAPGTSASAVAVMTAPWLFLPWPLPGRLALLVALFLLGAWAGTQAERVLGEKDPSSVVIDELVGQWIVLLPLPSFFDTGITPCSPFLLLAGFALFRLFDIVKPGPIHASENWLPGGWGIMLDDVLAGLFGLILLAGGLVFFGS